MSQPFQNPFRPGAGHRPPYLAGREAEKQEFRRLLGQPVILENLVLTGLRGVGKTVLMEELKPLAIAADWLWVGTDLSEASSLTEEAIAVRLLTDLAVVTAGWVVSKAEMPTGVGFAATVESVDIPLDYAVLEAVYTKTRGLVADKLKAVLEVVWGVVKAKKRGIVFAYDEAQNLADHAGEKHYPLSLLLDVFQSVQRKDIPFMLVLVGLPPLFPKLVDARTFAERMFRVVVLGRLDAPAARDAIKKPIAAAACPVRLSDRFVGEIVTESGGYPYFIQFFCREVYDLLVQHRNRTGGLPRHVDLSAVKKKLDTDFFAGRWGRCTDRQRDLLLVIAVVLTDKAEFSGQEIAEGSKTAVAAGRIDKPFGASHISQLLSALSDAGLVYKNRHGRYSLAVPLFEQFIQRQFG